MHKVQLHKSRPLGKYDAKQVQAQPIRGSSILRSELSLYSTKLLVLDAAFAHRFCLLEASFPAHRQHRWYHMAMLMDLVVYMEYVGKHESLSYAMGVKCRAGRIVETPGGGMEQV